MDTLSRRLAELAAHPRAERWVLRFQAGFSGSSAVREYVLFAPPTAEAAQLVAMRLHNGVLLLAPAAVRVQAPVEDARLDAALAPLRKVHRVPIGVGAASLLPEPGAMDLPSVVLPQAVPPGPGLAVGLDIGGTGMKACALRDRVLVRTASAPTWPDGQSGVDSLVARARALVLQVAENEPIGSLGIGLAAPMAVGGQVVDLSTVLREKVGSPRAFDGFPDRVAAGLVNGPVALFNDLANLGRHLSAEGTRRVIRLQLGTSFGGCWIDANGDVAAVEMGRLVVDVGEDARPHPYLPLRGAMRGYLCNAGIASFLEPMVGHAVDPRTSGHLLRGLLDAGDPAGDACCRWLGDTLVGVVDEVHALLPGVTRAEVGGSMLQGPLGRRIEASLQSRVAVPLTVSAKPGHDGAVAAAWAPRVGAALKGLKRVG